VNKLTREQQLQQDQRDLERVQNVLTAYRAQPGDHPAPSPALDDKILTMARTKAAPIRKEANQQPQNNVTAMRRFRPIAIAAGIAGLGFGGFLLRANMEAPRDSAIYKEVASETITIPSAPVAVAVAPAQEASASETAAAPAEPMPMEVLPDQIAKADQEKTVNQEIAVIQADPRAETMVEATPAPTTTAPAAAPALVRAQPARVESQDRRIAPEANQSAPLVMSAPIADATPPAAEPMVANDAVASADSESNYAADPVETELTTDDAIANGDALASTDAMASGPSGGAAKIDAEAPASAASTAEATNSKDKAAGRLSTERPRTIRESQSAEAKQESSVAEAMDIAEERDQAEPTPALGLGTLAKPGADIAKELDAETHRTITQIRVLLKQGQRQRALKKLIALRKAQPELELPDDLKALLKNER
jgi:hypothetical protein